MSDFGFPRSLRIHRTRDYRRHRGRSRTFRTRHFLAAWAPGLTPSGRVGFTVSKKVGNSPVRSRVKRVLREWYRLHHHELLQSWDLVVIARNGAGELKLADVEAELSELIGWLNRRGRQPTQKGTEDVP